MKSAELTRCSAAGTVLDDSLRGEVTLKYGKVLLSPQPERLWFLERNVLLAWWLVSTIAAPVGDLPSEQCDANGPIQVRPWSNRLWQAGALSKRSSLTNGARLGCAC